MLKVFQKTVKKLKFNHEYVQNWINAIADNIQKLNKDNIEYKMSIMVRFNYLCVSLIKWYLLGMGVCVCFT